jgi:hypothetical protein
MTIIITQDADTTIDATFIESWIIDTDVSVSTAALAVDAAGAVAGRSFVIKGTLSSSAGPAFRLGDASLADSATTIRVDYLGSVSSGGAGLVALSGGVTFEVAGDESGAGLVSTVGTALDLRQGGNAITNDGSIVSSAGTLILSAGASDSVVNNGTMTTNADAVVSGGAGLTIDNNDLLNSGKGHAVLSSGAAMVLQNTGTISALLDAISSSGADAEIANHSTVRSKQGAGIAATGAGAVIENTAVVEGRTFGIHATGANVEITNSGTVSSTGTAIVALGDGSVVNTTAQLTGKVALVLGGTDSVAANLAEVRGTSRTEAAVSLLGTADFTNDGAVFARSGIAVSAGSGDNAVENTGSLHGHVKLGGGNDRFSALAGEIDGKVYGGKGNDVYEAGILFDIVEKAAQGTDTVEALVTWKLGANLENLDLIGDADADGRGNGLSNILTGNSGDNRLWGLGGRDVFVMQTAGGSDTIMDFRDRTDVVDVRGVDGITGYAGLKAHMSQVGGNVVIDLSGEAADLMLTIRNVDLAALTAADFLF